MANSCIPCCQPVREKRATGPCDEDIGRIIRFSSSVPTGSSNRGRSAENRGDHGIHEYNNQDSRLAAVASEYVSRPERTVIVAPERLLDGIQNNNSTPVNGDVIVCVLSISS